MTSPTLQAIAAELVELDKKILGMHKTMQLILAHLQDGGIKLDRSYTVNRAV